jgi:hypothetical protein
MRALIVLLIEQFVLKRGIIFFKFVLLMDVMTVLDVISPIRYGYGFSSLIMVCVSFIGVGILLGIGFLIGQRGALSIGRRIRMKGRISGAIALTLASIILLSGLWCIFLSPTSTYHENRRNFYTEISIDGQNVWNYDFSMIEEDAMDGSISVLRTYESNEDSSSTFNFRIYDQDNNVIWSRNSVSNAQFNLISVSLGEYRIEVQNPNNQIVDYSIRLNVREKVTHRPLDPVGQWLSIISLPVFGFGIWTWITTKNKEN